jgi:hypothetical protein
MVDGGGYCAREWREGASQQQRIAQLYEEDHVEVEPRTQRKECIVHALELDVRAAQFEDAPSEVLARSAGTRRMRVRGLAPKGCVAAVPSHASGDARTWRRSRSWVARRRGGGW